MTTTHHACPGVVQQARRVLLEQLHHRHGRLVVRISFRGFVGQLCLHFPIAPKLLLQVGQHISAAVPAAASVAALCAAGLGAVCWQAEADKHNPTQKACRRVFGPDTKPAVAVELHAAVANPRASQDADASLLHHKAVELVERATQRHA